MIDYSIIHEWELSAMHKQALAKEEYEVCEAIQQEIDKRIENGTINHSLMQGFKRFNPITQTFEGKPKYKGLNGLFNKYQKKQ